MTRHGLDIFLRQAILAEYEPYGTGLSGFTYGSYGITDFRIIMSLVLHRIPKINGNKKFIGFDGRKRWNAHILGITR